MLTYFLFANLVILHKLMTLNIIFFKNSIKSSNTLKTWILQFCIGHCQEWDWTAAIFKCKSCNFKRRCMAANKSHIFFKNVIRSLNTC